jgi:hypothetical protein
MADLSIWRKTVGLWRGLVDVWERDPTPEQMLQENWLRRALRDGRRRLLSAWFLLGGLVMSLLFQPNTILLLLGAVVLGSVFAAPVSQRNEARGRVKEIENESAELAALRSECLGWAQKLSEFASGRFRERPGHKALLRQAFRSSAPPAKKKRADPMLRFRQHRYDSETQEQYNQRFLTPIHALLRRLVETKTISQTEMDSFLVKPENSPELSTRAELLKSYGYRIPESD